MLGTRAPINYTILFVVLFVVLVLVISYSVLPSCVPCSNNNKHGVEGFEGSSTPTTSTTSTTSTTPTTPTTPPGIPDMNLNITHDIGERASDAIGTISSAYQALTPATQSTQANSDLILDPNTSQQIHDSTEDNYNFFKKNGIPLVYYGSNNSTATIMVHNSKYAILITKANGESTFFRKKNGTPSPKPVPNAPHEMTNVNFYDPSGNVAKLIMSKSSPGSNSTNKTEYIIQLTRVNGTQVLYSNINSTHTHTYDINQSNSFTTGVDITENITIDETNVNTQVLANNVQNNNLATNGEYATGIPVGQEDLYILKSQIVPPVCPRCPNICSNDAKKQQPPCPSCARCSETNSDGVATSYQIASNASNASNAPVANISPDNAYSESDNSTDKYSKYRTNNKFLPVPVVASFSTFGM